MASKLQSGTGAGKREPARNARSRPNPVPGCSITAAVAAVGGKWKLIVVYRLGDGPKHFAALRRLLPGISQKVLTEQLRELIDDGLVVREETGPVPAPVRYRLTEYGLTALPLARAMADWGETHLERGVPWSDGV